MPPNNSNSACNPGKTSAEDRFCPKCGAEMERIETGPHGPWAGPLQLCPSCYLVTWSDSEGVHVGQGVPVAKDENAAPDGDWSSRKPEEC